MQKTQINLIDRQRKDYAKQIIDTCPEDFVCILRQRTRSLDQNAILHGILGDISKQVTWHGQKFNIDMWKRLCVASWLREINESPIMVPALDGNGVDVIYQKTSKLNVSQCSELIEWCLKFGAENDVRFRIDD